MRVECFQQLQIKFPPLVCLTTAIQVLTTWLPQPLQFKLYHLIAQTPQIKLYHLIAQTLHIKLYHLIAQPWPVKVPPFDRHHILIMKGLTMRSYPRANGCHDK